MEMLSEPLSLLLLLTALVIEVLAPVLHYHQFGEAVRTARDAGFSALFTCGIAFAVFPTIRVFRREMETGTYEMALAHPVSRCGFFLAKSFGAFLAFVLFSVTVFSVALVMFKGAAVGGEIASKTGTIVRVYGPFFVFGVGAIILPLAISAAGALKRDAMKLYSVPSFPITTLSRTLKSRSFVRTMMIGTASTATSISNPWKKSVQHTAL